MEQLTLDFSASATARHRRAAKYLADVNAAQPSLFASWTANFDVHLHSPLEAVATIAGPNPERAHAWLQSVVGHIRPIKARRVAFSTSTLDRLLHVRPPAHVTLDAASLAVARALWAQKLGLKPLRIKRDRSRLIASSPRWAAGFNVKDAPWPAIATLVQLGLPLTIDDDAKPLMMAKLSGSSAIIANAGLAGSAVRIEAIRPELVEAMGLPGLAYAGEPDTGQYKIPLLAAEPLLRQKSIALSPDLEAAIRKATGPVKPLQTGPDFPWTLYDFQARDGGQGARILEIAGGVLLAGDMGSGKAISVISQVLTPSGKRLAGDIQRGDSLIGRDGRPTKVLGVFPQGERDLFRLTFTDGTTAVADDEHLWAVHSPVMKKRGRPDKVMTTRELRASGLVDGAGNLRWYIPLCEPVQFDRRETIPLPGYSLGALLGDGCLGLTSLSFASMDEDIVQALRDELEVNLALVPKTDEEKLRIAEERGCTPEEVLDCGYNITDARHVKDALRGLDLLGKRAWEKSVPECYLYGPEDVRRAVLQGLLDTDGGLKNQKQLSSIEFTSTSEQLADDVVWLVQSLGGTARKSAPVRKTYTWKGEKRIGRPAWRLSLQLPDHVIPFCTSRKAELYRPRVKYQPTRGIKSIEPAGRGEAVCFKVAAPDELFLLDHAVVSHNTTISLALAAHFEAWPLLVVAPLAAFSTWERQLGEMGKTVYTAEAPKIAWDIIEQGDHDAVVVSYDRLHALAELLERKHFAMIIADEAQRMRTPGSRRSRSIRGIAHSAPLRIGLSGTPMQGKVEELLPLGNFLCPGEWKPRASNKELSDIYPGEDSIQSLIEHLGTLMVRRRMDQVGTPLPQLNEKRVYVDLLPEQKVALAALAAEAQAAKENKEFEGGQAMNALVMLGKAKQILDCPELAQINCPNPKITAALDLAEEYIEQGRKGVIFCAHRKSWQQIRALLDQRGIKSTGIWGASSIEERRQAEKDFHEDDETKIFVGTLASCSESLTLSPTATFVLQTAYVWSPSDLAQANARAYRLSSKYETDIVWFHCQAAGGTLDDRTLEILNRKRALFARVIDGNGEWMDQAENHLSLSDMLYLLTGKEDKKRRKREEDNKKAAAAALKAPELSDVEIDQLDMLGMDVDEYQQMITDQGSRKKALKQITKMGEDLLPDEDAFDVEEDDDLGLEPDA